jgi:hypothetical protein
MAEMSNPGSADRLGEPRPLDFERAMNLRWEDPAPEGGLQIFTALSDFTLSEKTVGYRNRRVRLTARLDLTAIGDQREDHIELVFDASAPTLAVPLSKTVVQGDRLSIKVQADDDGLSGVARVEYAIDEKQLGEIKEPLPAIDRGGGEYEILIPKVEQKPGEYHFLVRAVDRVGRVSSTSWLNRRPSSRSRALRRVR